MPRQRERDEEILVVKLTRKFAQVIDGVNIARAHVGDRLELPQHEAEVLIAEGWAELVAPRGPRSPRQPHAQAADKRRQKRQKR